MLFQMRVIAGQLEPRYSNSADVMKRIVQALDWSVNVQYQGWHFGFDCRHDPYDDRGNARYENGRATCQISLPDYVDFDKLSEPMLVQMQASVSDDGDHRPGDINLHETLYVDLSDKDNWK